MKWRDRLREQRLPPALADRARVAAARVGRTAPAGRGGLPAALARTLKRRRAGTEEDEAPSSSADEATINGLRAELAQALARAAERSDEQGERRPAGR